MTKKTFSKILLFGISTIAITALLIVTVVYSYYDGQTQNKLTAVASIISYELEQSDDYSFINNVIDEDTRITLIDSDGTVLADSSVDFSTLDNHLDREEVQDALTNGTGASMRKSATLQENTYYYAMVLDDGRILRVSTMAKSVAGVLGGMSPYIIIAVIAVVIIAVFVSIAITKSILKPVEELGEHLDDVENYKTEEELKPFVNAIKEQSKKRRALDKQKKEFTANVSHELKTPLTSIAGYAELIESGMAKEEDIKPFASVIRKQALRLVSLSEDIIKLSELDEGTDRGIDFRSLDIYAIAQNCVNSLSINAKNKNVSITLEGEQCFIRANESLLEELIYNLCDNAIRYNKENGSVRVIITPVDGKVKLSVCDTGIGIDEKYQERIFERFFRVDKSRSKATGGTGLGLAIVKHIAQIHGAELSINSVLGEGTEINIIFDR